MNAMSFLQPMTRRALPLGSLWVCLALQSRAVQAWREITVPTVAQAAAAFPAPPREYGAIHWAIWGGPQTREGILAQIEQLHANGAYVIMLNASRGLQPKYFSAEYMGLVRFLVDECKKRGMKVWLEDDGGYPSGFAGGAISRDYPGLAMQGIVADGRYMVAAGQTLRLPVPPDTLGILAYNRQMGSAVIPVPPDGQLAWTAPDPGMSVVVFVRHVYRSSPTRYTNRADGTNDKDSLYSLIDYLDPEATRAFLKAIHEGYEKVVGDEFGKTILGFRGDEPDYTGFMPWTPRLLEIFRRTKGYDLLPYIPQFFEPDFTPEVLRAKADYWDVWSGLFRDNFFKPQSDWCRARGMEYMVHLNHEELMINLNLGEDLVRNEGSFFRAMRYVGVPGVDNLNQIGPGIVADFPKLAASAAHVFGRPQVWNEEGGGLLQDGKFVADYNFARGMNFLQIRGLDEGSGATPLLLNPAAAAAWYVNRASYLLAIGRPAAQVALYHPTDSMWLGDKEADDVTVKLVTELMEHQIDFDHIDLDGLASVVTLGEGGLRNLSGQVYRAVIVPTSTSIDARVLERLRAFAAKGGRVIFVGRTPSLVIGRTYLNPERGAPDLSFATLEPTPDLTERVIAALPAPDVKLDCGCPPLKYLHRKLGDGDVYFFFNESQAAQLRVATLEGRGDVQVWDATRGTIHPLSGVPAAAGRAEVPLDLGPQESRFIVIGPAPQGMAAAFPTPSCATIATPTADWTVTLGDKRLTTPLKSWDGLGLGRPAEAATYRNEIEVPENLPTGKRLYLDLGAVQEFARVTLNGRDLEARAWPPYRWDVSGLVRSGANQLEIRVQVPPPVKRHAYLGVRRAGTPPAPPRGFFPTGVPGGLGADDPLGAGALRAPRGPPGQGLAPPEAPELQPPPAGLLGPVRLVAQ
jgi:hypothetical protein